MTERIVGRDAQLIEVDRFLAASQGGFAALVLEGAAGIGKTTLWREALRRAEAGGVRVLACRPPAAEAKLSFAALADMLARIDDAELMSLPDLQREALEVVLMRRRPVAGRSATRAVAAGLRTLVGNLARKRPVLLAVDDWQWLDAPSRSAIEFSVRRLEDEPVGLLSTVRPDAAAAVDTGSAEERVTRVTLEPLSLAALGRIISARMGGPLPRPYLVRIAQASGGNPFSALEIVRAATESGAPPAAGSTFVPVPEDVRKLTAARVRRLPAGTRDAVLLAAVLSEPDRSSIDLEALAPAEDAGIVSVDGTGRVEFAHPLFAAAAYGAVPAARRRDLHRRAAELATQPEERARHLALAAAGPDSIVAGRLDEGAAQAAARGAPGTAAELSELAARLTPSADAAAAARRLLQAARHRFDAGDPVGCEQLVQAVLGESPAAAVRARALHLASELAARRSSFVEATELALAALEAAEGDPELCATIELHLVYCAVSAGDFAGAQVHAQAAVARAQAIADDGLLADTLAVLTMADFLCGRGVDQARLTHALALESSPSPRSFIMRPLLIDGMLALWTGRLDEARRGLEAAHADAVERGQEAATPMLSLYLVWAYLWRGEFGLASRFAARSLEDAELAADPTTSSIALSASALAHAHDGHTDVARREAGQAAQLFEQLQWRSGAIWPLWALGLAELSEDNPAGVHALLGPLVDQVSRMGAGDPVLTMFVPDEVEALIALGELDLAETYLEPFERLAAAHDRRWAMATSARCRGALEAARGARPQALAAFDRALELHRGAGMPFEEARTRLLAGQALRRFKQRGRAAEFLSGALAEFERAGAPLWAARARSGLERTGRRAEDAALTETERRVAELAAAGLSNREVAAQVSVSVKTVESNLTRVYRKLGVRSRVGLSNALRAESEPGSS